VLDAALAAACSDRATAIHHAIRRSPAPHALARARYTDDRLSAALARGVRQYVLVGAGLDTCAFRRPDLHRPLRVFEVDHPATQAFKRARLAAVGLEAPETLHFVPADFERESVADALRRSPFDPTAPASFAWLGVTPYLTAEAILATLAALRSGAAGGSELVFDYVEQRALRPDTTTPSVQQTLERAREVGEPIITGFDPATLGGSLARAGFRLVEDLGPAEQDARYFGGRTDGLRAREFGHVASAEVS